MQVPQHAKLFAKAFRILCKRYQRRWLAPKQRLNEFKSIISLSFGHRSPLARIYHGQHILIRCKNHRRLMDSLRIYIFFQLICLRKCLICVYRWYQIASASKVKEFSFPVLPLTFFLDAGLYTTHVQFVSCQQPESLKLNAATKKWSI